MTFALRTRAAEREYRVAAFDTLDSTNAEAMRRARAGESGPLWIVTREQTAGRGRRGRKWQGGHGDLAASILITVAMPPAAAATLGFVAGIALLEALRRQAPGIVFTLKWPNDVLGNGRKLAGILLESEAIGDQLAVVVGLGVNIVSAPENVPFPASSLTECGAVVETEALFSELSDCWIDVFGAWNGGRGMSAIRDRWLMDAAGRGEEILVRSGEHTIAGVFETLDERGALVLRRSDGRPCTVAAGEVYFGNAATQWEAR